MRAGGAMQRKNVQPETKKIDLIRPWLAISPLGRKLPYDPLNGGRKNVRTPFDRKERVKRGIWTRRRRQNHTILLVKNVQRFH